MYMKEGWLVVCFCMFCLSHGDLPNQTMVSLVAILIHLESPPWVEVQWVGFLMFEPTMKKLLNIEQNFP
jgi:hypothetical protein